MQITAALNGNCGWRIDTPAPPAGSGRQTFAVKSGSQSVNNIFSSLDCQTTFCVIFFSHLYSVPTKSRTTFFPRNSVHLELVTSNETIRNVHSTTHTYTTPLQSTVDSPQLCIDIVPYFQQFVLGGIVLVVGLWGGLGLLPAPVLYVLYGLWERAVQCLRQHERQDAHRY